MMFDRSEDGFARSTNIVKNDRPVCLDCLLSNRSLVWATCSSTWHPVSVMNSGSNNFAAFGVEAFNICRSSPDKFRRPFGDASQDFFRIRTKRQSSEQISECFFVTSDFLNVPSRRTKSCRDHKTTQ